MDTIICSLIIYKYFLTAVAQIQVYRITLLSEDKNYKLIITFILLK